MSTVANRIGKLADDLKTATEIQGQALHDIAAALDEWIAVQQAFIDSVKEEYK